MLSETLRENCDSTKISVMRSDDTISLSLSELNHFGYHNFGGFCFIPLAFDDFKKFGNTVGLTELKEEKEQKISKSNNPILE